MIRPLLALSAASLLAACNTVATAPPPGSAPSNITPSTFSMPTGAGCAGEVARFQAVIDNDVETGNTTKGVHDRVSAEIAQARSACTAGNEAGANRQVAAAKAKFGYR